MHVFGINLILNYFLVETDILLQYLDHLSQRDDFLVKLRHPFFEKTHLFFKAIVNTHGWLIKFRDA